MADVLVVGCGLIGTSIGLALQGSGRSVALADVSPESLDMAVARGAGRPWDGESRSGLLVAAVPPRQTAPTLLALQDRNVALTYTHVTSVQSHVQREIEARSLHPSVVVGGHPMAGREVSGPRAALPDLFVGRPWAVCASHGADPDAVRAVEDLATTCGAAPVRVDAEAHDAMVAVVSHLPQIVASALAGVLVKGGPVGGDRLELAGPGLADTTRLAAADARLWAEILSLNAAHVLPPLRLLADQLQDLSGALEQLAEDDGHDEAQRTVAGLIARGNVGRGLVPVKRGARSDAFAGLRVELADSPGALASLLVAVGELGVNVEDVRLEHVPGRPRGVVELLVEEASLRPLAEALAARSWVVLRN